MDAAIAADRLQRRSLKVSYSIPAYHSVGLEIVKGLKILNRPQSAVAEYAVNFSGIIAGVGQKFLKHPDFVAPGT